MYSYKNYWTYNNNIRIGMPPHEDMYANNCQSLVNNSVTPKIIDPTDQNGVHVCITVLYLIAMYSVL